jgi:hypothetical protein
VPFVRFTRDRRGYEHVYLVDAKEHGRSRVIYWFRTPPGVKVGRSPFDSATQRSLEQQYPDVTFDWTQIVAARMPPPAPVENWREKRRAERAFKRARAEESADVAEQGNLQRSESEPLPSNGDNAEVDIAVDEEAEPGPEPDVVPAAGEDPARSVLDAPAPPNAVSGTRRKRRRRRRARRPDRPPEAAASPSTPDGPLDPADAPEKPSNEG